MKSKKRLGKDEKGEKTINYGTINEIREKVKHLKNNAILIYHIKGKEAGLREMNAALGLALSLEYIDNDREMLYEIANEIDKMEQD